MNGPGNPTNIIVFYSKFSNACKQLDSLIKQTGISGIDYVCADNHVIRRKLKRDRNLRIREVPCVLIVYDSQQAVKHEGENCFNWFNHIISKAVPKESDVPPSDTIAPTVDEDDEWDNPPPDVSDLPNFMKPHKQRQSSSQPQPSYDDTDNISNYDYDAEWGDSGDTYNEDAIIGSAGGRGRPTGVKRDGRQRATDAAAQMAAERESLLESEEPSASRYG